MPRKDKREDGAAPASPRPFARIAKWAGAITAVISFVFGVQQFTQMVSETRERKRSTDEFYKVGKLQQSASDYSAAWASFEQGLLRAEPGGQLAKITGQLGSERKQFRAAQEDLAMEWLRNLRIRPSEGETFTEAIAPLVPILTRGIASTTGERQADLLAHFGWANFLRSRDGQQLNPEPQYRQAIAADAFNPYAHAYLAHWLLWTRRGAALPEAREHFAAALRSGRAREEVRAKQLSAFRNLKDQGEADFLRAATEMRRANEPLGETTLSDLRNLYKGLCGILWRGYDYEKRSNALRAAIPAADHMANADLLFGAAHIESEDLTARACRATLLETFGNTREAREVWTAIRPEVQQSATWRDYGIAALKRLP